MFFISCTVLIQLVLLNTLIAIMGDTFDKVQEGKSEALIREMCSLISENAMWLNHKDTFGNIKYLAVANIEQADGISSSNWEGKLQTLKTFFS